MDPEKIVNKRLARIAKDHRCSVAEVTAALDRHPIEVDHDTFLRRTLAMELVELDELEQAFRESALVDRDVAAGALLVKLAERRATLLGLNAPIGQAVQVIQHEPSTKLTSTQKMRAAIDNVMHITPRERELADKHLYSDDELTAEEQAELDQLRSDREAKPARPGNSSEVN
jgi:hypothetical protein